MSADRILAIAVVAVVLALVVYIAAFAMVGPKVDVSAFRDSSGRMAIALDQNWRVRGIYSVAVWLDGDPDRLWQIERGLDWQGRLQAVICCQVPQGWIQKQPAQGVPTRTIPNGQILYIEVGYQWDSNIPPAACGTTRTVKFKVSTDGALAYLGEALPGEGLRKGP